jgi:hypothetical protein
MVTMIPYLRLIANLSDQGFDFMLLQAEASSGCCHHIFFQHGGTEVVGPET